MPSHKIAGSLAMFGGEAVWRGDFGDEGEGEAGGSEERGPEAASEEAEQWTGIIGKREETRAGTQAGKADETGEDNAKENQKNS